MRRALVITAVLVVGVAMAGQDGPFGSAGSAQSARPKPKPWQWAPAKIEKRLVAAATADCTAVFSCFEAGGVGRAICAGTSPPVAGRYSAFRCRAYIEGPNITPDTQFFDVLVRIRPLGSGVFCVVSTPEGKAVPPTGGTATFIVAEGRRC